MKTSIIAIATLMTTLSFAVPVKAENYNKLPLQQKEQACDLVETNVNILDNEKKADTKESNREPVKTEVDDANDADFHPEGRARISVKNTRASTI